MSEPSKATDLQTLALSDLRAERETLRKDEDAVSFVRRLAQGRVDLVVAVRHGRHEGSAVTALDIVKSGVGPAPSTGSARPPRDTDVAADHPLLAEFDALCDRLGFDNMADLDDAALESLEAELRAFESTQSEIRRRLFDRIDALTAELVRRYRDGGASVDALLEG
ncbi:MAG: hypothetical protein FJW09_02910 [Actinobacteria bacterium]|nr:hypothetical protein [Actinomycetota bacterium]